MDPRLIVLGGQPIKLEGNVGIFFQMRKEEDAFYRLQKGEFLDLERQIAKVHRA
jgi:hypothetical protein